VISAPGVYPISADEYHGDPVEGGSLTSSGAVKLVNECPAKFDYERRHPLPPKDIFDFGSAAHRMVLGAGRDIVVVDADNWMTKAAKAQRDEARANGLIPLLAGDYVVVKAMAAALRNHPMAAALLDPERGTAEQTLVWQDGPTGVWCRALVDFLPHAADGRYVLGEYKSAVDASPAGCAKAMFSYSYHQRAQWYVRGAQRVLGDAALVLIFQEKSAPYLVHCAEPDAIAMRHGRDRNDEALEIYAACTKAGRWPGYEPEDEVAPLSLPDWLHNRMLKEGTW
jgi:hypothetical protein